jgi:hypothetical protein
MQFNKLFSICIATVMLAAMPALAAPKAKTYDEPTFIKMLGNKTKKQVTEMLGEPVKKQLSVKPSNAETVIGRPLTNKSAKPDNVEMWYYSNIVRYEAKKTYKTTELTFVNGKCTNVAFFNNP